MSSCAEAAGGAVAAAVALPVAAAFGVGWLAWQGGKLLFEANQATNRAIAEKKRQLKEITHQRKVAAIAAHQQLADICSRILTQMEATTNTSDLVNFSDLEQLKYELKAICDAVLPDDTIQIESMTSSGYLKLDKIVQQRDKIAKLKLADSDSGIYRGLSVADLLDDMRVAFSAMQIHATRGSDVRAADPIVLERQKLNERFATVAGKTLLALENIASLAHSHHLTVAANTWFNSCFNGMEQLITRLVQPTVSNQELKKGIQRLEESLERYELMLPTIEKENSKMVALYEVYQSAAKALGESIVSLRRFQNSGEIERELVRLKRKSKRAEECAEIYRKLGPKAYLCYAWDQELRGIGYQVHTRAEIAEMALKRPGHAKIGDTKLPFYVWSEDELTQMYSISKECSMQLIVHEDGSVSMQTLANYKSDDVISTQQHHCSQLQTIIQKLKDNWFITYGCQETMPPDIVETFDAWRDSDEYAWRDSSTADVAQGVKKKKEIKKSQIQ